MRIGQRVVLTIVAMALVFGMGVHYDVAEDRHWPYPDSDDLAVDDDAYVGETTLLFGTVRSVDASASTAVIEVEHDSGTFTMTVHGFEAEVEPGGVVQVLGTVEPDHELTADRVVVVNRSGGAELLKFGLSGLGALVVLLAFFRDWRVDWEGMTFEAR